MPPERQLDDWGSVAIPCNACKRETLFRLSHDVDAHSCVECGFTITREMAIEGIAWHRHMERDTGGSRVPDDMAFAATMLRDMRARQAP